MAQIREELVLYDKFTQTFTRYIRLGEQAAGATNQAKRAVDQFRRQGPEGEKGVYRGRGKGETVLYLHAAACDRGFVEHQFQR